MTLLVPDIRHRAYEKFGEKVLGTYSTAIDFDTDGVTDTRFFNTEITNVAQFQHWVAWRPALPMPNRRKVLDTLVAGTGKCLIVGSAYTDPLTELNWEKLPPDIDLDVDVNAAIREAQRDIYFPHDRPATLWANGAFDTAVTTHFASSTGAGLDVEYTELPAYNETGFRSLMLTYTAPGILMKTALPHYASPGDRLALYALIIPISGVSAAAPITFDIWDEANNQRLAGTTQIAVTTMVPQTIGGVYTVPAGVSSIGMRIGAANGAIVAVDAFPSHNITAEKRLALPTNCDAPFKLLGVSTARYDREIDATHAASRSRVMASWNGSSDYRAEGLRAESMTPRVAVRRDLPDRDIWFHTLRDWYSRCPMDGEQKGTQAPEDLVLAACYLRIAKMLVAKRRVNPWAADMADWQATLNAQFVANVPAEDPKETSILIPGGRAGRYSGG